VLKEDVSLPSAEGDLPLLRTSLLTGGGDKPYAVGLTGALLAEGICLDVIGSDDLEGAEIFQDQQVRFKNFRGNQDPNVSWIQKAVRVCRYYLRLFRYTGCTDARVFHILWANRLIIVDRVLLIWWYRLFGKKLVFTAHNVNEGERDETDGIINRLTLRALYRRVDHVFVHTEKIKAQLAAEFNLADTKVSVIPFGINNTLPRSTLTPAEAKAQCGFATCDKIALCFGNIAPYKGLEHAVLAMGRVRQREPDVKLIIAGRVKGCASYWMEVQETITREGLGDHLVCRTEYIPDDEVERLFKAADVLILPYRFIYQSGVLFLAYSFGLPVIATDVGSLREHIIEGETGFICQPENPGSLADAMVRYFGSDLYKRLDESRMHIIDYGNTKYSWDEVGRRTRRVYEELCRDAYPK